MSEEPKWRHAKAAVFLEGDDAAYVVTETPSEVLALVEPLIKSQAPTMVQLTSGNKSQWNGKPIYSRGDLVKSISPPMNTEGDEDD